MSEERIEKIINSKMYPIISITILSWTLALYWISVSGFVMLIPKILLLFIPVIECIIRGIVRNIRSNNTKKRAREKILLKEYLRRLNEKTI